LRKWSDSLKGVRDIAAQEAKNALIQHGFIEKRPGEWHGLLKLTTDSIAVRLIIPLEYPDKLPEVFLINPENIAIRSHIERTGKICIAPSTGTLLDTARPGDLISDTLRLAMKVLNSTEEEQQADIQSEFIEYWTESNDDPQIWSILNPSLDSREVVFTTIQLSSKYRLLFANNETELKAWVENIGASYNKFTKGFVAKLNHLPAPPSFNKTITTQEFDDLLLKNMLPIEYEKWKKWDGNRYPPVAMLMSARLPDGSYALFATRSANLSKEQEKAIQNPYSRKSPSTKRIRQVLLNNRTGRRGVTRLDLSHLLNRTSGQTNLEDARIAIVGCGAVGSQIAVAAVAAGVRFLKLIDNDLMTANNTYRHILGSNDIGKYKVHALSRLIKNRFPLTNVTPIPNMIEKVLDDNHEVLAETDLVVFALGDETLERRINSYLGSSIMRLHTWVEPYGIGGHCLLIPGGEKKGCYECLYSRDEYYSLYNMASLCRPGQTFQKTTGGCAGVYTPFGYVDTLEAASRTVRKIIYTITSTSIEYGISSWIGDEKLFLDSGHVLSKRGERLLLTRGEYRNELRSDCPVCSIW